MKIALPLCATILLGACSVFDRGPVTISPTVALQSSAAPVSASASAAASDSCGAARLQSLVGQQFPDPFPADGPVWVHRGAQDAPTDVNPRRVKVELGWRGSRIRSITCG